MKLQLRAVRLFVRDLEAARGFYAETLGLTLRQDGSTYGYCVFDAGAVDLVVETVAHDAPADDQALVARFSGLSFAVDDIAAAHQRLQAMGVHFTGLPEAQFWGGWLATFCDPAGNELQLAQYGGPPPPEPVTP
jgi:predicted enzyme related to lactoylglutathione lyase